MNGTVLLREISGPQGDNLRDRMSPTGAADRSDLLLVERCAQDDPAALRELLARYQEKLYRYLVQVLGTQEDAEEAVMDVFLQVWRNAGRFEKRSSFGTWVYRIATNVAYDRLRRQKALRRTMPTAAWAETYSPDAQSLALGNLEADERARLLDRCLQHLRIDERMLLTLYYQEELSYEEISRITRYPAPVLRVRLMRARRRLRAAMDAAAPEEQL